MGIARTEEPGRARVRSRNLLVSVAFVIALLVPLIGEIGHRSAAELDAAQRTSAASREAIERLRSQILAMESAKRGYILTGRAVYLKPFEDLRHTIDASVRTVEGLADPSRADGAAMAGIAREAALKISEMREVMRLWEEGRHAASMDLMLTDIGLSQMERIDALAAEARRQNDAVLQAAVARNGRNVLLSRMAVLLLAALFVAVSWRALHHARKRDEERAVFIERLAAERDHLDEQVRARTVELTELARHLQSASEHERTRLARLLHDELGGVLTAAKLDTTRLRNRLDGGDPALLERLRHLNRMLDSGIAVKRRIIDDLHPATLESLGLLPALHGLLDTVGRDLPLRLERDLQPVALGGDAALVAYRVVQEALDDALRHADVHAVSVAIRSEAGDAVVTVRDDGRDPAPDAGRLGRGLESLRFRVQSCGGVLTVEGVPAGGTIVCARLPLASGPEPARSSAGAG